MRSGSVTPLAPARTASAATPARVCNVSPEEEKKRLKKRSATLANVSEFLPVRKRRTQEDSTTPPAIANAPIPVEKYKVVNNKFIMNTSSPRISCTKREQNQNVDCL